MAKGVWLTVAGVPVWVQNGVIGRRLLSGGLKRAKATAVAPTRISRHDFHFIVLGPESCLRRPSPLVVPPPHNHLTKALQGQVRTAASSEGLTSCWLALPQELDEVGLEALPEVSKASR